MSQVPRSPSDYKTDIVKKKFKLDPTLFNVLILLFFSGISFGLLILGNEFSYALVGTSIILGLILSYLHSIFDELVKLNSNFKNDKSK